MFGEMSFWQMLMKGGVTVAVLLVVSVVSWWIIVDKALKLWRIRLDYRDFMDKIRKMAGKSDDSGAITLCETTPGPVPAAVLEGLRNRKKDREQIEAAMQRSLNTESARLQKGLGVLGTIGNVSPFIGLFGTVIGIIRAFHDLAATSGGGPSVVANGIAEALVATAAGIFVAVPAVIAYNLFQRAIDAVETDVVNASSELIDILED